MLPVQSRLKGGGVSLFGSHLFWLSGNLINNPGKSPKYNLNRNYYYIIYSLVSDIYE